ncbi:MAG: M3 family oligoendopeptidase, partial [Anaerolineae bacterium]|nr:M3 family oligoendopeptidase [Anaerolineae bacterium]
YASPEAWAAELKSVVASLAGFAARQGHLGDGPEALAEALEVRDELARRTGKLAMYARMSYSMDTTDPGAARMQSEALALVGQVRATVAFVEPEVLALGRPQVERWLQAEPRLQVFAHYFDDLFRRQAHLRSAEVEELLGMLADPFASIETTAMMLTDADLRFLPARASDGSELAVTQGTIDKILGSADREARRTAWESYHDGFLAFKNTLASNLVTSIKRNVFQMRARRYGSTLEASLFENNVPVEVFHNLVQVFRANLPIWHRYWAVRRRALGVEALCPYDIWAPLTEERPQVTYEQAVDWISQGLAPLGREYVEVLRRGCLEERWVDVYPNQGKTGGAFSYGSPGTYPFIAMNFDGTIYSLGTLAHELGHSMHSYLTWQTQPMVYSEYSLFVAEVASNFHQAMVRAHLLQESSDRVLQIAVIEEGMSNLHRYLFVMPTLARFELEVHERLERGEGLSADDLIELLADLYAEGYGGQMQVDRQRVGVAWATFPHLYSDYYV